MGMRIFSFRATDRIGRLYEGRILARDAQDAETKMHEKGYYVKFLNDEGETSEEFEFKPQKVETGKRLLGFSWNDLASYGIPAVGMISAIIGIFVLMRFLNPAEPARPPDTVVREYFAQEKAGDYKKQYELFSAGRRNYYGSGDHYADRRKGIGLDGLARIQGGGTSNPFKLENVQVVDLKKRNAQVLAHVLRPSGALGVAFYLVNFKGQWRIEYVRDPDTVKAYLNLINEKGGYDQNRDLVREMKLESGMSDLDIQEQLKAVKRREW